MSESTSQPLRPLPRPEAETPGVGESDLPRFALLAAPDAIAGTSARDKDGADPTIPGTSASAETSSPSRERAAFTEPADDATRAAAPTNRSSTRQPRLDAKQAEALRAEARRRSETSRAELEAARKALAPPPPDSFGATSTPPSATPLPAAKTPGWEARPLVGGHPATANRRRTDDALEDATVVAALDTPTTQTNVSEAADRIGTLEVLLSRREADLLERTQAFDALQERFDAQTDALQRTREALELERQQNTPTPTQRQWAQTPTAVADTPGPPSVFGEAAEAAPEAAVAIPEVPTAIPPIFSTWLDDQVRRHFGPLGLDRFADLVRQPLENRSASASERPLQIAWLCGADSAPALQVAEDLEQRLDGTFQLHVVAKPFLREALSKAASDAPLARGRIIPTADLESPRALNDWLNQLEPDLIVSHQYLSSHDDAQGWIETLEHQTAMHRDLLVFERTGLGAGPAEDEQVAVGERIWDLMPDRYKQTRDGQLLAGWNDAFALTQSDRERGVLEPIRNRFAFAFFARFGFLSEAFVTTEVGANFSADTPKDRRFLRQIADLDDKRIESGAAPALHFVAMVQGRGN